MVTCENKGKEMREIEFKVKFITPLLIGGANPREADPSGLTGKALRGCWHFWFRAIMGGIFGDINKEELLFLESKIFGSPDAKDLHGKKIGAKFRMIIEVENELPDKEIKLGFNLICKKCKGHGCDKCNYKGKTKKLATSQGLLENSSYRIKIIPRNTMSETELNILFSTIWVWGNLGAVGKRERRGFGSPIIGLKNEDNIENENNPFSLCLNKKEIKLPIKNTFEYPEEIEGHLQEGLSLVWSVYNQWIKENGFTNRKLFSDISGTSSPKSSPFFLLRSCEQIFVGNAGFSTVNDAITIFHGKSNCDGLGWAEKKKRMASPLFIRFHKAHEGNIEKLFPLISWCQQKNVEMRDPDNCALVYLKKMKIDGKDIFVNNLNGGNL